MEKILLVEHNKILSKYISRLIESKLDFKVDIASNIKEVVKLVNENRRYFLALVDIKLPATPSSAIVNYLLVKNIPSIILTDKIDDKTRSDILSQRAIDYINKTDINNIEHIANMVDRIYKNQKYKVLIVDDSSTFRKITKKILQKQLFQVLTVSDSRMVLEILARDPQIKIIILDYHMPGMNGLELLTKIRKIYKKDELSVIAVTGMSFSTLSAHFLKKGANDFIKKPFIEEEMICRVNNTIEIIENIQKIKKIAEKDFLTDIDNRRSFYEKVKNFYEQTNINESFALGVIDIDHFKRFNDTFGHDVGDRVLKKVAAILRQNVKREDILARLGGEEFVILLKNVTVKEAFKFFEKIRMDIEFNEFDEKGAILTVTVSVGVFVGRKDIAISEFLAKADKMLYKSKREGRNRVNIEEKKYEEIEKAHSVCV